MVHFNLRDKRNEMDPWASISTLWREPLSALIALDLTLFLLTREIFISFKFHPPDDYTKLPCVRHTFHEIVFGL